MKTTHSIIDNWKYTAELCIAMNDIAHKSAMQYNGQDFVPNDYQVKEVIIDTLRKYGDEKRTWSTYGVLSSKEWDFDLDATSGIPNEMFETIVRITMAEIEYNVRHKWQ